MTWSIYLLLNENVNLVTFKFTTTFNFANTFCGLFRHIYMSPGSHINFFQIDRLVMDSFSRAHNTLARAGFKTGLANYLAELVHQHLGVSYIKTRK